MSINIAALKIRNAYYNVIVFDILKRGLKISDCLLHAGFLCCRESGDAFIRSRLGDRSIKVELLNLDRISTAVWTSEGYGRVLYNLYEFQEILFADGPSFL